MWLSGPIAYRALGGEVGDLAVELAKGTLNDGVTASSPCWWWFAAWVGMAVGLTWLDWLGLIAIGVQGIRTEFVK